MTSRASLKKYVQNNNKGIEAGAKFDSQFNRAIKSGVESGIFAQPKGRSTCLHFSILNSSPP